MYELPPWYTAVNNQARLLGIPVLKNPIDLFVMQEVILECKPDLIIETGTFHGASAMYWAILLDFIGKGRVVTIDISPKATPEHDRITYVRGKSIDVVDKVEVEGEVMVILDSDHAHPYVLRELNAYGPLVTPGQYLIVEDTVIGEAGPLTAVRNWLPKHPEFEVDRGRERFGYTYNPEGYLRRREN